MKGKREREREATAFHTQTLTLKHELTTSMSCLACVSLYSLKDIRQTLLS